MKYIVAVSGGVDSVVLLDMLVKADEHELVVAHFDHGIRQESADDASFVAGLARRYGIRYETRREELGPNASEEQARIRRYTFLRELAEAESATIVTAHHKDDIIETIAINLIRGTGWRGLAVLGDLTVNRPLLGHGKQELYDYALQENLEWVQDATNQTETYLRNRIRRRLGGMSDDQKHQFLDLWANQRELARLIDGEALGLATDSRYFMTMIDDRCAIELLRHKLAEYSLALTRPQRVRLLYAIKAARPGSTYEAGAGIRVGFTKREFIVKYPL
ncbi:MAG: tRNA lysidine(34) synthetase TilS [Patescibacteria group bacterium]